jgi:hypothetical protein
MRTDGRTNQNDKPLLIRDMLAAGFGVEDIKVKTGLHLDYVRFVVRGLRYSGELDRGYERMRGAMRRGVRA